MVTHIRLSKSSNCGKHGYLDDLGEGWEGLNVERKVDLDFGLHQGDVIVQGLRIVTGMIDDTNHGVIVDLFLKGQRSSAQDEFGILRRSVIAKSLRHDPTFTKDPATGHEFIV